MDTPTSLTKGSLVLLMVFLLCTAQLLATACSTHDLSVSKVSIDGVPPTATPLPQPPSGPNTSTSEVLSSALESLKGPPPPSLTVPILMYHHIGTLPPNADAARRDLTVSGENFEAQMALLFQKGYETIPLEDLVAAFEGARQLPAKPIILTFDDGYKDNFEYAYPILQKYNLRGTFFIITSFVSIKDYLAWDDIAEMSKGGMFIEAHGKTHADLTLLSYEGIVQQVTEAMQALQSHINVTPHVYCYPAGKFNETVINILRANGYRAAVSTRYGCVHNQDDLLQLRRVRISGSDSLSTFSSKLECQGSP